MLGVVFFFSNKQIYLTVYINNHAKDVHHEVNLQPSVSVGVKSRITEDLTFLSKNSNLLSNLQHLVIISEITPQNKQKSRTKLCCKQTK